MTNEVIPPRATVSDLSVLGGLSTEPALIVKRLDGLQPYIPLWEEMQKYTDNRGPESPDQIWLLEHSPVFTQGQTGKAEHVLNAGGIPIVKTDRGGQVTYHGPGQLVAYLLIDLRRRKLGVRSIVTRIEQAIINMLQTYGVKAQARADAPGVYIDQAKIASLGLRVRRGCTFHGLALNIDMDLSPFSRINPCGYAGLKMVQLKDFCQSVELGDACAHLESALRLQLACHQAQE